MNSVPNLCTLVGKNQDVHARHVVAAFMTNASKCRDPSCLVGPRVGLIAVNVSQGPQETVDPLSVINPSDTTKHPIPGSLAASLASKAWLAMCREQTDQLVNIHASSTSSHIQYQHLVMEQIIRQSTSIENSNHRLHVNIVKAHILLDALTCVTTVHGKLSARCGKLTELQFDTQGALVGAKTCDYHLDCSRAGQSNYITDSNFHIFYALVHAAGNNPDLKRTKLISDVTKYNILCNGSQTNSPSLTDAREFQLISRCMQAVGLKKRFQQFFFDVLAGLLHLGNVEFISDEKDKLAATIRNMDVLQTSASLLGVSANRLVEVLTCHTVTVGDSSYTDFLTPVKAQDARSNFISEVYSSMVGYIIDLTNQRLNNELALAHTITIVDMGGIENADTNASHQLRRNYAVDRMHQYCLERLASHLEDCSESKDSLPLSKVVAAENTNGPMSLLQVVFEMLEKATLPKIASESENLSPSSNQKISTASVFENLQSTMSQHPCYEDSPKGSSTAFSIRHTYGIVGYSVNATLKQMSSSVTAEVISLCRMENNTNPVLLRAFSEQRFATYRNPKRSKTIVGGRPLTLRRAPTIKQRKKGSHIKLQKQAMTNPDLQSSNGKLDETEDLGGPPDDENEVPLSRLSNNVYSQHRMTIDKLIQTLADCNVWELILSPVSAMTEELVKQLHMTTLISSFSDRPYSIAAPLENFSKMYPAIFKEMEPIDRNLLIDRLKEKYPGAKDLIVLTETQSLLFKESDWLALEAAEYHLQPDGKRLYSVKDFKETFERIKEKCKRSETEAEEKSIVAESMVSQDEAEIGELATPKAVLAHSKKGKAPPAARPKRTPIRRRWELCTTFLTWWIPDFCLIRCGGMPRSDVRQSWREKVALCILIMWAMAGMIFFITGFSRIMCPEVNMYTLDEFRQEQTSGKSKWFRIAIHGDIFDATNWMHPNVPGFPPQQYLELRGKDASALFPRWNPATGDVPNSCGGANRARRSPIVIHQYNKYNDLPINEAAEDEHLYRRSQNTIGMSMQANLCIPTGGNSNSTGFCHSYSQFSFRVATKDLSSISKVAKVAWNMGSIGVWAEEKKVIFVVDGKVYDATDLMGSRSPLSGQQKQLLQTNAGKDITSYGKQYLNMECLDDIASIGVIDTRDYIACNVSTYILFGVTGLVVATMVIKFLSALQLGSKREPEEMKKYAIMQVPCYSEGVESLRKTINSLAVTDYDDTRKLLFIVADGLIKGSGNEKPTPDLVLDILGVSESHRTALAFSYHAVSEGTKGHNKAKVYSGLYHISGRAIPYVVVIKCGTELETTKAGNRGKRDSQMILMKWMNKVLLELPMTPLELEMYRHVRNIIGVPPASYEYVLMVDADTEVGSDCLTRLVSACVNDAKIMGICGETRIANEKQSWVTMIQVYEYYISHHLSKAFESMFGSVTCLPGCFSMYRLFSIKNEKKTPVLVDNGIITAYSECVVDTLHKKNLLHLGEDRYLTTLMLKTFPDFKMKFAADSHCLTIVPDKFSILVSQRRRWVNSTIHNLFELTMINDMCGCLIFSMRFIVILDLFATLVMPASVAYLFYLVYSAIQDFEAYKLVMYLVAITYGIQAAIFLIKCKWEHIGWMIVHIVAMPVFYLYIPLYSYWNFDDFSWGATRRIEGETGHAGPEMEEDKFDPESIPTARWEEYKKSKKTEESLNVAKTVRDSTISKTNMKSVLSSDSLKGSTEFLNSATSTMNLMEYTSPRQQANSNRGVNLTAYSGGNGGGGETSESMMIRSAFPTGTLSTFGVSPSMNNLFMLGSPSMISMSRTAPNDPSALISDDMLMNAVRILVLSQDLTVLTKKKVRAQLGAQFGVDLSSRRVLINECIDVVLFEVNQH